MGDDYSRSLPDNSRIHFLSALTFFAVGIGRLRGLPLPPTPNLSRAAREIIAAAAWTCDREWQTTYWLIVLDQLSAAENSPWLRGVTLERVSEHSQRVLSPRRS